MTAVRSRHRRRLHTSQALQPQRELLRLSRIGVLFFTNCVADICQPGEGCVLSSLVEPEGAVLSLSFDGDEVKCMRARVPADIVLNHHPQGVGDNRSAGSVQQHLLQVLRKFVVRFYVLYVFGKGLDTHIRTHTRARCVLMYLVVFVILPISSCLVYICW